MEEEREEERRRDVRPNSTLSPSLMEREGEEEEGANREEEARGRYAEEDCASKRDKAADSETKSSPRLSIASLRRSNRTNDNRPFQG